MKINICDGIPDLLAVQCVAAVVQMGKISNDTKGNKYYCWATKVPTYKCTILVLTHSHRKSDCFTVMIDPDWVKNHPGCLSEQMWKDFIESKNTGKSR